MRNGILTLLVVLGGAGVSLAQSVPNSPYNPIPEKTANAAPTEGVMVDDDSPSPPPLPFECNVSHDPCTSCESGATCCFSQPQPCSNRFWIAGDYLLWWTKSNPVPVPLVTTGSIADAVPGAIGQAHTDVLFGDHNVNYGATNGLRLQAGWALDGDQFLSLEGEFFILEQRSSRFKTTSDVGGNPLLALPFYDVSSNIQNSYAIAFPGEEAGGMSVSTRSRLDGWELNLSADLMHGASSRFDLLAGYRSVFLSESLQLETSASPLQDDSFVTYLGQAVSPPNVVTTVDRFRTYNQFYGGQIGGRFEWGTGPFTVGVTGKVALGDNQELVQIGGVSALTTGVGTTPVPGGILAVASNSGRFFRDEFSVVPEVVLQFSYELTSHLEANFGYSFLYLSNVVRPGNQVDRAIAPTLVPTDFQFGTAPGSSPAFQFHSSDYWAQGLTFGLTIRY
jgi:hypothetical protein